MKELSDGNTTWVGGMDSSIQPDLVAEISYARAANVIVSDSLGGIRTRFGIHCQQLNFKSVLAKEIYQSGRVQAEGYFNTSNGQFVLVRVVKGYVLQFIPVTDSSFDVYVLNENSRNNESQRYCWVTTIPNGCIVNDGKHFPLIIGFKTCRRSDPNKGEIGIGRMGVYVQNRFFYVNGTGRIIEASDFLNPIKKQEYYDTGILGFVPAENTEEIVAIGRQKVNINYVDGGALAFATRSNFYSVDVRADRITWATQGTSVGKVNQSIPGIGAASAYSFESFNSNLYFRNSELGICDIRQSQYQFTGMDDFGKQSAEASYWLNNDTKWMLDQCYTRSYNGRLFTTVSPERTEDGYVFWNGFLSMAPASEQTNIGSLPKRYESVFTGVRPWCLTSVRTNDNLSKLYIDSYDSDGITRLYKIEDHSTFDKDENGNMIEIEGWIETKAYNYKNPFKLKKTKFIFYKAVEMIRNVSLCFYARFDFTGEWVSYFRKEHKVKTVQIKNELFEPVNSKSQSRQHVMATTELKGECNPNGDRYFSVQDRIEFKGFFTLGHLIRIGIEQEYEKQTDSIDEEEEILAYEGRKDYNYLISKTTSYVG